MVMIQSAGQLTAVERARPTSLYSSTGAIPLYNEHSLTYAAIIRSQPAVRTAISFIARNIAQLGIGLYDRLEDDNRDKIRDHEFLRILEKPNPLDRRSDRYSFIFGILWELGAYDVSYRYLVETPQRRALIDLPVNRVIVEGKLWPERYKYRGPHGTVDLDPSRILHFQASRNLENTLAGLSPIESLRRVLAEDVAAGEYREQFWRSGARISGVIERPPAAPEWSTTARDRFAADWSGLYTGDGPAAGGTPILEDGMVWKEAGGGADARSAQYIEGRKLTREEAAAAFHISPIWLGISGAGDSYASVRERHKALYQDDLGPWVTMFDGILTGQMLPMFEPDPVRLETLYVKLNVAEKLRGAIDDQADAIIKLTGRPILTPNEGRALLERNSLPDGDGLTVPLNVVVGGQTIPGEAPPGTAGRRHRAGVKAVGLSPRARAALEAEHLKAHRLALARTFGRQERAVMSNLGAMPTAAADELLDRNRWDKELGADLYRLAVLAAGAFAQTTADALGFEDLDETIFDNYLTTNAAIGAANINATTADALAGALLEEDSSSAVADLFAAAAGVRAVQIARTRVTGLAGFGTTNAAQQAGRKSKVWIVASGNPRESHAAMDGETVPIGSPFSLGGAWPGDPVMGPDEISGCTCLLEFD